MIAPLGRDGSAELTTLGVQAADRTRYGGFFVGGQSTEKFLLAADGDERVVAAVCQGNQKHTNTMVAGVVALSELFEHVCGHKRVIARRAT